MSDNCPFCGHHWQALADLNHSILLEKRLSTAKIHIAEFRAFAGQIEAVMRGHSAYSAHSIIQQAQNLLHKSAKW